MPDSKITALTSISTSTDPANDPLVIVDVSDTSMAATGTTKKVTLNQLLGASGTATLASATITGALTANGNISMANATSIFSSGAVALYVDTNQLVLRARATNGILFQESTGVNNLLTISNAGVFGFLDGAGGTRMTLNSTGLGVGGSPSYKLDVQGTSAGVLRLVNILNLSTDPAAVTRLSLDGQGATWHLDNERTNGIFKITRNSTACLTIDNSANVGIGVTPSAKFDVGLTGAGTPRIRFTSASDNPILEFQRYSGVASDYYGERILTGGGFFFQTAPAAAVGSQTFTTRMSLDASGRLILLASTTTPATLSTNGQLTMTATSDTNLRFSYRGSDGVTRVANLTLA